MSQKDNNILKYNHEEKLMKVPFVIYADINSLLERIDTCHQLAVMQELKNPENYKNHQQKQ